MRRGLLRLAAGTLLLSALDLISCSTGIEIANQISPIPLPLPEPDYSSQAVAIPMPKRRDAYFASIRPEILSLVQGGTPDGLRSAIMRLRRSDKNYSQAEAVLLVLAAGMLSIAWGETAPPQIPEPPASNPYTGALDSARAGIYDTSTGRSDMLSLMLPSLALFSPASRGDFLEQSVRDLNSALALDRNSVLARYMLGLAKMRLDDYRGALTELEAASAAAPNLAQVARSLSWCLYRNGMRAKSLASAEGVLKRLPGDVQSLALCATICIEDSDWGKAEEYATRILRIQPESGQFTLMRARIFIEKRDYIKASSILEMYARKDPDALECILLRARLLQEWNSNARAAAAQIERALELYPGNKEALSAARRLCAETGVSVRGAH